ncbi:hypothetical protein JCM8202_000253 [Rhodotorula sphaerocarpa]
MPVFPDLRRFPHGITFKQWTGKNTIALLAYIAVALYDLTGEDSNLERATVVDEIPEMMALLAIFTLHAKSNSSTDTDRHTHKQAFLRFVHLIRQPDLFEFESTFKWPRMHAPFHYTWWTQVHGTAPNHDTAISERNHKVVVKDAYRRTNHLHLTVQILIINMRRDAHREFQLAMHFHGVGEVRKPRLPAPPPATAPVPIIEMKLRGTLYGRKRIPVGVLAVREGLPDLVYLLDNFMRQHLPTACEYDELASLKAYVFKTICQYIRTHRCWTTIHVVS